MPDLLPLPQMASREGLSARTVRHWIVVGVRLPDGSRVRLSGVRRGGRWWLSADALRAFDARCTAAALPPGLDEEALPVPCPAKGDAKRLAGTLDRLKAMGVLT